MLCSALKVKINPFVCKDPVEYYKGPTTPQITENGNIYFLDRLNYKCDRKNSAITSVKYVYNDKDETATVDVNCIYDQAISDDCYFKTTPYTIVINTDEKKDDAVLERKKLNFLDRQTISCKENEAIRSFVMVRSESDSSQIGYKLQCCPANFSKEYKDVLTRKVDDSNLSTKALNDLLIGSEEKDGTVLTSLLLQNDYDNKKIYYKYSYAKLDD